MININTNLNLIIYVNFLSDMLRCKMHEPSGAVKEQITGITFIEIFSDSWYFFTELGSLLQAFSK